MASILRKVLITGGDGMLATDLVRAGQSAGMQMTALSHGDLDVTDWERVRDAVAGLRPDLVINTPGIGVDACEDDPAAGYRIHTWASGVVARSCESVGACCVYISTCGLFGDEVRFHSEFEPVELKTKYARSKYLGEQAAFAGCSRTFVVRPGWLYGGSPSHRRNFVYQRYLDAQKNAVLQSASDKFGCPTNTGELARKIFEVVETQEFGVYHITNSGGGSRYDYVKCIVDAFGLDTAVEPTDSSSYPRAAPVPDCEMLENLNLRFLGLEPMAPWREAIERYVREVQSSPQSAR